MGLFNSIVSFVFGDNVNNKSRKEESPKRKRALRIAQKKQETTHISDNDLGTGHHNRFCAGVLSGRCIREYSNHHKGDKWNNDCNFCSCDNMYKGRALDQSGKEPPYPTPDQSGTTAPTEIDDSSWNVMDRDWGSKAFMASDDTEDTPIPIPIPAPGAPGFPVSIRRRHRTPKSG